MAELEREFRLRVEAIERDLSVRLRSEFSTLKVDNMGRIVASTSNVYYTRRINRVFDEIRKEQQKGLIPWLVQSIKGLLGLNKAYFDGLGVNNKATDREIRRIMLASFGYDDARKQVLPGGFLDSLLAFEQPRRTITQQLTRAVLGGTAFVLLMRGVSKSLEVGKGLISRLLKPIVSNTFLEVDRRAQSGYAEKLGLDYALYSGTIMEATRDFCEKRNQNVYTREEVAKWDNLQWQGKIPNVSIFVQVGGYNCRHHFSWMTKELAQEIGRINQYNQ